MGQDGIRGQQILRKTLFSTGLELRRVQPRERLKYADFAQLTTQHFLGSSHVEQGWVT